jgi:hypothetical protein
VGDTVVAHVQPEFPVVAEAGHDPLVRLLNVHRVEIEIMASLRQIQLQGLQKEAPGDVAIFGEFRGPFRLADGLDPGHDTSFDDDLAVVFALRPGRTGGQSDDKTQEGDG